MNNIQVEELAVLLQYGLPASLLLFLLLERGAGRWAHLGGNLGLWLTGNGLIYLLLGSSYGAALLWLDNHRIGVLQTPEVPLWLVLIIGFLAVDLADYLAHRLSHRWRWLWLLHAVHHSDRHLDASTNLRGHPLHLPVLMLWRVLVVAALGVPLWVQFTRDSLALMLGYWHHSSWRAPVWTERLLRPWLITPAQHHLHHSSRWPETDSNFGAIFNLWDRLFGTWRPEDGRNRPHGLEALRDSSWHSLWGMLTTPWRARSLERL